jgi:hypothetical protein
MVRFLVVLAVTISLAGCSLVNPYVINREVREGRRADGTPAVVDPSRMTFREAREYAGRVKEQYRGALVDQAQLNSWLGIGLIPLTAAAMGLGASGGPATGVLALGLTGGAAFGTATWLSNRPRQAAYVAGIKAVTCAEAAVQPLALTARDEKRLTGSLDPISDQIATVDRQAAVVALAIDTLEAAVAKVPEALQPHYLELVKDAKSELTAARSLMTSAQAAYDAGTELQRAVDRVGEQLGIAIDKIVDAVDGIIADTQRDPQALAAIINNLGGTFKTFTTVPESVKATMEPRATRVAPQGAIRDPTLSEADNQARERAVQEADRRYAELSAELKTLRDEEGRLAKFRREVTTVVNPVAQAAPLKTLETCGVKSSDVATALALNPAGPIPLARTESKKLDATGGVSPYWASVKGPGEGVTVTQPVPLAASFVVTAAKDAQAGSYVVSVGDGSGQIKSVEVSVKNGTPPPSPPPGPSGTTGGGDGSNAPSSSAALDGGLKQLASELTGKSVVVAGFALKMGTPERGQEKVLVPAEVVGATQPRLEAFTEARIVSALLSNSASGLRADQVAIKDFAKLKAAAEVRAKAPSDPGK